MVTRILIVAATVAAAVGSASAAAPGSIVSTGKSWTCSSSVDLTSVTVTIDANDPSEDGVFLRAGCTGYIGCYSANDSQATIHEGVANQELPTNVIFNRLTADPAGVQDPTGSPLYHYGAGGAYGIANGQSSNSGFTNLTLLSLSHLHDLYQGADAVNPVWSFRYLPPGVRKSPGIP